MWFLQDYNKNKYFCLNNYCLAEEQQLFVMTYVSPKGVLI